MDDKKEPTAANCLPCPFCGSKPVLARGHSFYVLCEICLGQSGAFGSVGAAVAYWNRRANIEVAYQVIRERVADADAQYHDDAGYWTGFLNACEDIKRGIIEALNDYSPTPTAAPPVAFSRGKNQVTSNKGAKTNFVCNCGRSVSITRSSPEVASGRCICGVWYTLDGDGDILPPPKSIVGEY